MQSQLLHNQWFGKAIGFTAAFVLAPYDHLILSVCIILGIGLGHLFDIWAARESAQQPIKIPLAAQGQGATSSKNAAPHLQFLFAALGCVAKSTGTVSAKHIKSA